MQQIEAVIHQIRTKIFNKRWVWNKGANRTIEVALLKYILPTDRTTDRWTGGLSYTSTQLQWDKNQCRLINILKVVTEYRKQILLMVWRIYPNFGLFDQSIFKTLFTYNIYEKLWNKAIFNFRSRGGRFASLHTYAFRGWTYVHHGRTSQVPHTLYLQI